ATTMKVVIADDEPLARERLRALLAAHPDLDLVAEAGDGRAALHACAEHDADVVLLDIAMPGIDGLEAARHLSAFEPRPAVVFCTAYDAHALSAFEAAAVDYLVKPVRDERLHAALERARTFVAPRPRCSRARRWSAAPPTMRTPCGRSRPRRSTPRASRCAPGASARRWSVRAPSSRAATRTPPPATARVASAPTCVRDCVAACA